jgi:hypothetical protein
MDRTTGVRTLINDAAASGAVKAYLDAIAPTVKLQSSATVNGGFADDASATVDTVNKKASIPMNGPARFYRLVGASALTITSVTIQGSNFLLTYQ